MTPNNLVHENERLDELHRNGYYIIPVSYTHLLWLKNSGALGVEQYRKKNLLTLDFAYVTDPRAMKREGIVPGQELSLKMGYVMLAYILKVEKVRCV